MSETGTSREMNLAEWMKKLPECHRAHKEYTMLLKNNAPTAECSTCFKSGCEHSVDGQCLRDNGPCDHMQMRPSEVGIIGNPETPTAADLAGEIVGEVVGYFENHLGEGDAPIIDKIAEKLETWRQLPTAATEAREMSDAEVKEQVITLLQSLSTYQEGACDVAIAEINALID